MQPRAGQTFFRKRFLDAAWQLGCTGGYAAVKVRAIADQVGVSAALIYAYFEDKASLMEELRTIGAERLDDRLLERAYGQRDARVLSFCADYLRHMRELGWLYVDGHGLGAEAPCARVFFARAADVVVTDASQNQPTQLALHLWIGLQGLLAASSSSQHLVDDALEDDHLRLLLGALHQPLPATARVELAAAPDAC